MELPLSYTLKYPERKNHQRFIIIAAEKRREARYRYIKGRLIADNSTGFTLNTVFGFIQQSNQCPCGLFAAAEGERGFHF